MPDTPPPHSDSDEASPLLDPEIYHDDTTEEQRESSGIELYLKVAASMFSFFTMGMFLSTLGVLLPKIQEWYRLNDAQLSLVLPAGPTAYVIAAQLNKYLHLRFGQRGVAVIGPLLHLFFSLSGILHPPFGLFLACVATGGAGSGILDGSFCAWASSMQNKANLVSGLIHGAFSTGASVGPALAGMLLSGRSRFWYEWYYVMVRSLRLLGQYFFTNVMECVGSSILLGTCYYGHCVSS